MQRLTSIVAVNHQKVIGVGNALPWRLKSDLQFFREQTLRNVILMGRKTYNSLGNKPLPARFNVVVSHTFGLFEETAEATLATSIGDALYRAKRAARNSKEVLVVGGASMYEQLAPFVDRYLITLVDKEVTNGDTFFDDTFLRDPDQWALEKLFNLPVSDADEASFSVFEVVARDPSPFAERRAQAIAQAEALATAGFRKKSRTASARQDPQTVQPAYSML